MGVLSVIALGLTIIPGFFVLKGVIALDFHKKLMLAGTVLWFIAAPLWLTKEKAED